MNIARHILRTLLGLLFVFASATYFLNVLPPPPEMPGDAGTFNRGLEAASYFMPLLKSVELVSGLLLLSNRFVALALAMLAPIVVNIVAVHATLMPDGLVMVIIIAIVHVTLVWMHRKSFAPLFAMRAT